MKFRTRMILCAALPATLFVLALGSSLWGQVHTRDAFDRYLANEAKRADSLSEMYAQGLQMGQALRNIVLDPANRRAYENLDAARAAYDQAAAELDRLVAGEPEAQVLASLGPLRTRHAAAQQEVLALVASDANAAAARLNAAETPAWRELRGQLIEQRQAAQAASAQKHQATNARAERATAVSMVLALLALTVSVGFGLVSLRTLRRELGGEPAEASAALRRIAQGDLTAPIQGSSGLMAELQGMQSALQRLVGAVRHSAESIQVASHEVSAGAGDLSVRTERAAANLQQTAASMEQLNGAVGHSTTEARATEQRARAAAEVAQRGSTVVGQVVATMQEINASSRKIADIISTIDGIAFQTNILALNAAVEAARAGEQGRGFAVVAGEVRSLAQRSAGAAREIKQLIGNSVERVDSGVALVGDAGRTMQDIVGQVQAVSEQIGAIAGAVIEQREGIGQINAAVTELDGATQQNAALVEQSAAAAESLKQQASQLAALVATFQLPARA
jgi:methyl-accepting chemotaxis protein